MSLNVYLVSAKIIESCILFYANMRQKSVLDRVVRVPIDLTFAFSVTDLDLSKEKSFRRICHNLIIILWDLLLFTGACYSPGIFRSLWDASKQHFNKGEYDYQPTIFAITITLLFWFFRGHVVVGSYHFINLAQSFDSREVIKWWTDSLIGNCTLLLKSIIQTILVQMSLAYYDVSAKLPLALGALAYVSGSYVFFNPPFSSDDRIFEELPESRLKNRLNSMASVFGLTPGQVISADNWRVMFEGDHITHGHTMNLITTYYREESGGGHAKTFEVPEILSYIAHSLTFYKNKLPLVLSFLFMLEFMLKILLSFQLIKFEPIYQGFGFTHEKPIFIGLFLSYYLVLSNLSWIFNLLFLYICRKYYKSGDRTIASMSNGRYLARVLGKLDALSSDFPLSDPLYTFVYSSKPPLAQRIRSLNAITVFNNLQ